VNRLSGEEEEAKLLQELRPPLSNWATIAMGFPGRKWKELRRKCLLLRIQGTRNRRRRRKRKWKGELG
jgi:hypothetical protein